MPISSRGLRPSRWPTASSGKGQGSAADPYAIERQRTAVLKALAANRCRERRGETRQAAEPDLRRPLRQQAAVPERRIPREAAVRRRQFRQRPLARGPTGRCASGLATATTSRSASRRAATNCSATRTPAAHSARARTLPSTSNGIPATRAAPMVSLAGEPYTALSTAFRYRSEYDRDCTCGPIDASIAAAFQAFAMPPPDQALAASDGSGGGRSSRCRRRGCARTIPTPLRIEPAGSWPAPGRRQPTAKRSIARGRTARWSGWSARRRIFLGE